MSVLLVIGVGNPDRGDDAAGWIATERVAARCDTWTAGTGDEILVHTSAGDPASLIDAWAGADQVVIIDAVVTGERAGTLHVVDLLDQPAFAGGGRVSSHGLGPAEAVALGRALGTLPAGLTLIGIEAKSFEPGRAVSAEVDGGIEAALDVIQTRLLPERASGLHDSW